MTPSGATGRFAPTPKHGAALRWLIERLLVQISDCQTRENLTAIETFVSETLIWAASQDGETMAAYRWAADSVLADAHGRFQVFENSRKVTEAYEAMPKPPEPRPC